MNSEIKALKNIHEIASPLAQGQNSVYVNEPL